MCSRAMLRRALGGMETAPKFALVACFRDGVFMTISAAQRDLLRDALPDFSPFEAFAVDNRETFEALKAAASEFTRRRGDVDGRVAPIPSTSLLGGIDQVHVLRDLARDAGFEVHPNAKMGALLVTVPGQSFGFVVTVERAVRMQLGRESAGL